MTSVERTTDRLADARLTEEDKGEKSVGGLISAEAERRVAKGDLLSSPEPAVENNSYVFISSCSFQEECWADRRREHTFVSSPLV